MEHDALESPANVAYDENLPGYQLILEIQRLLNLHRRAERALCRYMADLADRIRDQRDLTLALYSDEFHAARCFFGLGTRETRERVRVGRALREIPEIDRAFEDGRLSYSRVREISRVATAETEQDWLALAQSAEMRTLERRVTAVGQRVNAGGSAADGGHAVRPASLPIDEGVRTEWKTPSTLRVSFELSAEAWALLERALEGARRASETSLSDAAALEALARDAIAHQASGIEASDPRRAVVLYECRHCKESEVDTGAGVVALDRSSAATFGCGATQIELEREGRTVARGGPLPSSVRRAVLLRDRCRCRVPGCRRRRYVDVHHIHEQARGGEHSRHNCLVLCTTHHRLLHESKLTVSGDAEGALSFRDAEGEEISEPAATQRGSRSSAADAADAAIAENAQGVSIARLASTRGRASFSDAAADATTRLLRTIGRRGGWTVDKLIEHTGVEAKDVNAALTFLELDGRIRRGAFGFEPA